MNDIMLGSHDEAIRALLHGQQNMQSDIEAIKLYMAERRGERRVGAWLLCTGSAMMGTAMAFLLRFLGSKLNLGS